MPTVSEIAFARQRTLIRISDAARARAIRRWRQMDWGDLDASWGQIEREASAISVFTIAARYV